MKKVFLSVVLMVVIGGITLYYRVGYGRGQEDFFLLQMGRNPRHAKSDCVGCADGGSIPYFGRGYKVYAMHQILPFQNDDSKAGYLGGAKIEWGFPIRIFASDHGAYSFIPRDADKGPVNDR